MFPGGDSEVDGSRVLLSSDNELASVRLRVAQVNDDIAYMTELLLRKMIDWNDEDEEENGEEDESLCGSGL